MSPRRKQQKQKNHLTFTEGKNQYRMDNVSKGERFKREKSARVGFSRRSRK